ncbi:hypothetical protein CMEL01_06518 [Colletotrichum melonis]|uniref:Uncharacterized protein n=2 Tax=Colletotrichum acutatum species complex TaxID=2707335 RepID=A0AAI9XL31_9PEZI|nr:hypothetical protein CMEL01_06518 [Colletotrichum melonis]KAK1460730.1 hypothetical protein CCUS01_08835 [Colletotrichum cuscutae]
MEAKRFCSLRSPASYRPCLHL